MPLTTTELQFRNFDNVSRKQEVSIQWEQLEAHDDSSDAPDQMQDGFWPSRDENDAGYVPPEKYDEQQALAEARMKGWREGDWHYIGVIARAHITVPIGGSSFTCFTMDSAGLWGIESDAGEYLKQVFEEKKEELLQNMAKIGAFAAAELKKVEDANATEAR